MTREQIVNDIRFRQRCAEYGLDWEKCEIYGDVILLNTPKLALYVLFDKNYNTIGVELCNFYKYSNKEDMVKSKFYEYCNFTDVVMFGEKFGYPFEKFTLKQIIDLSNRIEVMETNHGRSLSTKVNGDWYDRNLKEKEDYFQLLSYVKFLGEEIKQYFLFNYHMQSIGLEIPNVYEYVRLLIAGVDEQIDFHLNHNRRPWPEYILSGLGQNYRKLKMDAILYDIADLLMKDKGYQVKSDSPYEVEKIESSIEKKDLSIVAQSMLEILNLSDEELNLKEQRDRENLVERQLNNLRPYLQEDIEDDIVKEKGPVLKKNSKSKKN